MKTIKRILHQMSNITKPQQDFLLVLFSTIMIFRGQMNFRNMSRYSSMNEKTYSRNFRKSFDFALFNHLLISETVPKNNKKMARFQIEFIFRDAKQHTGLTDCQSRCKESLDFHFNASLTALNLLKKQDREQDENLSSDACSISSWKTRYSNKHLLSQFISHFDLDPISIKNTPRYEELINYGAISA